MTKEKLEEKVNKCLENSERILNDSGSLIPMLDIEFLDDKDKTCIVAVGLALGEDRNLRNMYISGLGLTFGAIQRMGKIKEVKCVVMMSEAWFSSPSKAEWNLKHGNIRPSQDPNRREMLLASGLTADGICLMRGKEMFSIEVKGKRHFTLKDVPEMSGSARKTESRVLELFFTGYKKSLEQSEKNQILDIIKNEFGKLDLDEILKTMIKVLTKQVGGVKSEFIKYKK